MSYVFGPVPSRRLGLSLGVDLIPFKTCTFDCMYCQVGRTTLKTIDPKPFSPVQEIMGELEERLSKSNPDVITAAGSGEPLLNSRIHKVIDGVKALTKTEVAVLTNGSLLWKKEIRERLLKADIIIPTLTTASQKTFERIHRPHADLKLDSIVKGLELLRDEYKGKILLEVVLLAGINDSKDELRSLKELVAQIRPDRIQLNTVVRPPADAGARPLEAKTLEYARGIFGESAEIIADTVIRGKRSEGGDGLMEDLVEAIKRRPMRKGDLVGALDLSVDKIEDLLKVLLTKGYIKEQKYAEEIYYHVKTETY